MKNYQEWYDHIADKIENKPFLLSLLRTFNRFMTVVMPIVYLTLLVTTYLQQGLGKQVGIYVFIPASGFVILSWSVYAQSSCLLSNHYLHGLLTC